jgi:hypothetical protein
VLDANPQKLSRLISDNADAIGEVERRIKDRSAVTVSLKVGANVITHNLGRVPTGATVTPTVADATWAWAFGSPNATTATITTVGVPQPNAPVEFY